MCNKFNIPITIDVAMVDIQFWKVLKNHQKQKLFIIMQDLQVLQIDRIAIVVNNPMANKYHSDQNKEYIHSVQLLLHFVYF